MTITETNAAHLNHAARAAFDWLSSLDFALGQARQEGQMSEWEQNHHEDFTLRYQLLRDSIMKLVPDWEE